MHFQTSSLTLFLNMIKFSLKVLNTYYIKNNKFHKQYINIKHLNLLIYLMRKRKSLLNSEEICFYYFEMVKIILYLLLSIAQMIIIYIAYIQNQSTSNQYYNKVLNDRLTTLEYTSNFTVIGALDYCPDQFDNLNIW